MWKYVSRRVRDTFERSANYFDKRGTTGVTNAPCNNFGDNKNESSPPCRWFLSRKCWTSFSEDTNTNSKRWNYEYLNSTWLSAITWSSAVVMGWYASQLIHLKHKYKCKDKQQNCPPLNNLLTVLSPYVYCINSNSLILNSAPEAEKVIASFRPTVHLISNDHSDSNKERPACSARSSSSESVDSSGSDLGDVLNSIENRLGLAAIENGQHQEGLNMLQSAANRNHAPAIYNLGLCYEMGLGVKPNEKMAMECYKSAATLEHPGALYNLGIYYGQGRGGLARDTETATRLLRLAALKGQAEAMVALKTLAKDVKPIQDDMVSLTYKTLAENDIVPTQTSLFV